MRFADKVIDYFGWITYNKYTKRENDLLVDVAGRKAAGMCGVMTDVSEEA